MANGVMRCYERFLLVSFKEMCIAFMIVGLAKAVVFCWLFFSVFFNSGVPPEKPWTFLAYGLGFFASGVLPYAIFGVFYVRSRNKPDYWWPLQRDAERAILATMSRRERIDMRRRETVWGLLVIPGIVILFSMMFSETTITWLAALSVVVIGIGALKSRDVHVQSLCSTPYATEHGIGPKDLRLLTWDKARKT